VVLQRVFREGTISMITSCLKWASSVVGTQSAPALVFQASGTRVYAAQSDSNSSTRLTPACSASGGRLNLRGGATNAGAAIGGPAPRGR
jgi:hypothetical protein